MKHQRWLLILILLVATALRLGTLPDMPLGLHYDEAANGILARQIAEGDYRPIFIHAYTGKEVLFFYAAAPWVWITGNTALGMRLAAAMLGVLTVAATYAATRALFNKTLQGDCQVPVLAAGWLAVAFPHVLLSRYGFRAISQPLMQALTVAALWRGLRGGKKHWLVAGGLFLGWTGYTYLAARLFPIPLGFALLWMLWHTPASARRRRIAQLSLALGAAVVAFAPLGWHFLQNPDAFTTRIGQVASATWQDALRGLWLCARALVWPGAGDAYVRFNAPGRPMLDAVSAILALVGVGALLVRPRTTAIQRTSRVLILSTVCVMLLPSALATSEITPSNLRLVGLWPFLAMLPAYGLANVFTGLSPSRQVAKIFLGISMSLFALGAITTWSTYCKWATSADLFYASDGEMALAAQVVDDTDLTHTTVYIASEHYRHPTVAALAKQYPQVKWLTGGATWVLPPTGNALTLVPRSLTTTWPDALTQNATPYLDPEGESALRAYYLSASDIADLRQTYATKGSADFAHIVSTYDAHPIAPCHVAEPCTIQVTWEALAPYPALEPVVRLVHSETGEWARTQAFHYPPGQWTLGDVVLDQYTFTPPVGTPPGDGYQISVGWYNPDGAEALPRLENERFAGLEVRYPPQGFTLAPQSQPPTPPDVTNVQDVPPVTFEDGHLLGWQLHPDQAYPGERLTLAMRWQADANAPANTATPMSLRLVGPETYTLYTGPLSRDYGVTDWRPYEILQGRYIVSVPKHAVAGSYALTLHYGDAVLKMLSTLHIADLTRNFAMPSLQYPQNIVFGEHLRLLGYDKTVAQDTLSLTLYWETLVEVDVDYVVFVHIVDKLDETIIAQVDEMPRMGEYATSLWVKGEIIADTHTLDMLNAATGDYALRVGLYLPENGQHLQVAGEDFVILPGE